MTPERPAKTDVLGPCSEHLAREYHEQSMRLAEPTGLLAPVAWEGLSPDERQLAVVTMRSLLYRGVIVCTKTGHRIRFSLRERV